MKKFAFKTAFGLRVSGNYFEFPQKSKKDLKNACDMIFIHAFPLDSEMYIKNFKENKLEAALNKISYTKGKIRIFLPDMPGFGRSELFNSSPINLLPYVDVINEIVNHFQIKSLILGGCSMGGYIVLEYVRNNLIIIEGLVLIDTKPQADNEEQKQNRLDTINLLNKSLELYSENERSTIKMKDLYTKDNNIRTFIENLFLRIISQNTQKTNPKMAQKILNLMKKQRVIGVIHALNGMAGRNDTSDVLKDLQVESLIIVGENDVITPIEIAKDMKNLTSKVSLEIITSKGHLSNMENSSEFNQKLLKYLELKKYN